MVGAASVAAAIVLLHAGHGLGWYFDEWQWAIERRTGSIDDFLANHNGHLNLLPVAAYKVMWSLFGLTDYTAFRVMVVALHVATCLLLFAYLRRRSPTWFALSGTVVILFLGRAWQDLLWPFQIQYVGAVAFGLAALVLLDRRGRAGDVGASIAIGASLACSGVGLPFAGGLLLELALRRDTWRRLWVPLAPLVLYGIWYLQYGESQAKSSNLHLVPSYTARMGAASIGALAGTVMNNGRYLIGGLAVLVIVVLARTLRISPRFAAVLAMPIGYWVLTALSRAGSQEPDASRYLYPGAVFVVLILSEMVASFALPRAPLALASLGLALVLAVGISIHGNLDELDKGAAGLRDTSNLVEAELGALQLVRARVDPGFRPDLVRAPQVVASGWFRAVDDLGSPAPSLAELRRLPERLRSAADVVLIGALRVAAAPPTGASSPCPVLLAEPGSVELHGDSLDVTIEASASAGVDVAVRNLASEFDAPPIATVPPGSSRTLSVPTVRSGPWAVRLTSAGPVRACTQSG